ncbi:MAG: alpha-E domain-containing protein, partial [Bacteroidota bacterium]
MLSRIANAMYWMNRYVERAENYARFMDVNFNLSLESAPNVDQQWKPLVVITGDWERYSAKFEVVDKRKVIYFMGFDPDNPNSIYSSICLARENARAIRPELTKEVWERINALYHKMKDALRQKRWEQNDPRLFFTEIKEGCQLLYGIYATTITRSDGWHFGKLGQLIERADKTSRVLDVKYHILLYNIRAVGSPLDLLQWGALLKSVSAYDMYRKKYGKLKALNISEFLILDEVFPRSMYFCLMGAEASLKAITGVPTQTTAPLVQQLEQLRGMMASSNIK